MANLSNLTQISYKQRTYSRDELAAMLPPVSDDANKYTRGRLVLVGGSKRYPGAACLAAYAGQRMGAGYTEVFIEREAVPIVQLFRPSLVVGESEQWEQSVPVKFQSGKPCAYVVGPGFAPDEQRSVALTRSVLARCEAPVLVDGGAIGFLASEEGRALLRDRAERGLATIVTPHAGEAARLICADWAVQLSEADAPQRAVAELLASAYDMTVVLKGPQTWIAEAGAGTGSNSGTGAGTGRNVGTDRGANIDTGAGAGAGSTPRIYLMDKGTPALAKAGTGDVLAGMIGALLAQGLPPFEACVLGTTLHAHAARAAAEALTAVSVTPEDVIEYLPRAITALYR